MTEQGSAASVDERCPSCGGDAGDNWFDRSICPSPCDSMHTRCVKCGTALDGCPLEEDRGPRIDTASEVGSLPDTKEGRYEGREHPAASRDEVEALAARMAYDAGLGVSEWEAFVRKAEKQLAAERPAWDAAKRHKVLTEDIPKRLAEETHDAWTGEPRNAARCHAC